ncbi:redoxin domain-containing protein [Arachidicoccus sp.]|uniref:redoxin domain-containing protein n=1 Tax=Arachidicoccus sp. TaxID=1872624 RepID=UPI003D20B4FD
MLLFLFGTVKVWSQPAMSSKSFNIKGKVNGISIGTIILSYPDLNGEKLIFDSSAIKNGTFQFKGTVKLPVGADLYIKGSEHRYAAQNLNFYLENSPISICVNSDSISSSKVTGSFSNDDKDSIAVCMAPYYEILESLRRLRGFASAQHSDSILKSLENIYGELPAMRRSLIVGYAFAHPNSYAITSMLNMDFTNNQTALPLLKSVYNHFSNTVKSSIGGQGIASLIKRIERVQIGKNAPEFSLPDQNGKNVHLASFNGKYILLDFWASWCVPCRAESPYLVKAYKKYKDKNFTVISVSLDDERTEQNWMNAFKKDGMQWTQLCSLKGYADPVRMLYSVQGIPDNFLISPAGKIIARGLRGEEIGLKLAEIFK